MSTPNKPLLIIIAGLTGAASLGSLLALSQSASGPSSGVTSNTSEPIETAAASSVPVSIEGTWIYAERGGADGQTSCGDFARPALYKLNGNMGEVAQYYSDGRYRAYFTYTTPSGEEHSTKYSAHWELEEGNLVLTDYVAEDAFRNEAPRVDRNIQFEDANVAVVDERRYVRCVGETGLNGE